jgi:hypothetical protein
MTDEAEPQPTQPEADPPPADRPTATPEAEPAQPSDELLCTICGLRACWRA